MGGAMLWHVLWDYHTKIENNLIRYSKGETTVLRRILEEIEVYGAVEEEIVFPVVGELIPARIEQSQESLDNIKELSADIENLEPGDPAEAKLMKRLTKAWKLHTSREQRDLFPVIKTQLQDEQYDMARHSFAVRQELVAARGGVATPEQYYIGLPGSGWTKQKVIGGGW